MRGDISALLGSARLRLAAERLADSKPLEKLPAQLGRFPRGSQKPTGSQLRQQWHQRERSFY